jgi:hypothetical protein
MNILSHLITGFLSPIIGVQRPQKFWHERPVPELCWKPFWSLVLHHVDKNDNDKEEKEGEKSDVESNGANERESKDVEGKQKEHDNQVEDCKPPAIKFISSKVLSLKLVVDG